MFVDNNTDVVQKRSFHVAVLLRACGLLCLPLLMGSMLIFSKTKLYDLTKT